MHMGISIGIRELRQNASRYLRLVRAGQTITLTDRGEPFAEIHPVKQRGGILEQLIASGRATAPTASIKDFLDRYHPEPRRPGEPTLSEVLDEQREERL
jgi:prevent-host-death family protein